MSRVRVKVYLTLLAVPPIYQGEKKNSSWYRVGAVLRTFLPCAPLACLCHLMTVITIGRTKRHYYKRRWQKSLYRSPNKYIISTVRQKCIKSRLATLLNFGDDRLPAL